MFDELIGNSEAFYQSLGLTYRVVNIASGTLNNAAAMKYDLEAHFAGQGDTYRELVSCSNCTDYQSRKLNVRFGQTASKDGVKTYVHMLNCTLCATERTICCLVEQWQTPDGVRIPEPLRVRGRDFFCGVCDRRFACAFFFERHHFPRGSGNQRRPLRGAVVNVPQMYCGGKDFFPFKYTKAQIDRSALPAPAEKPAKAAKVPKTPKVGLFPNHPTEAHLMIAVVQPPAGPAEAPAPASSASQ